jgi:hypothetical protein
MFIGGMDILYLYRNRYGMFIRGMNMLCVYRNGLMTDEGFARVNNKN